MPHYSVRLSRTVTALQEAHVYVPDAPDPAAAGEAAWDAVVSRDSVVSWDEVKVFDSDNHETEVEELD